MFSPENLTLIRGRCCVPVTFWRTRQWRRCDNSSFFPVLISVFHEFCREHFPIQPPTGLSCLPCVGRVLRRIGRPSPCKVPAGRSCESPPPLDQPALCSVLRSSAWYSLRPSL